MKAVVFRAVGDIVSPMGALTEVELMSPVIGTYEAFHRRETRLDQGRAASCCVR